MQLVSQICISHTPHTSTHLPHALHLQLFDVRTLREVTTFNGHQRDVAAVCWHPMQVSDQDLIFLMHLMSRGVRGVFAIAAKGRYNPMIYATLTRGRCQEWSLLA
jgi:hypothetical protein